MPFYRATMIGTGTDEDPIQPQLPEGIWDRISGWAGNFVDGEYVIFMNVQQNLTGPQRREVTEITEQEADTLTAPHGHDIRNWRAG